MPRGVYDRGTPSDIPRSRFKIRPDLHPEKVRPLAPDHPAMTEMRTIFPTRVRRPVDVDRVLVSGHSSAKIGDRVGKGPWRGMRIFTLTLEERATCPETCHNLASCFGNSMNAAIRLKHGPALESAIERDIAGLIARFGRIVVRAHILGDFYSERYVRRWAMWMEQFPGLHLFGYTAWSIASPIGFRVARLNADHPSRCSIRFSIPPGRAETGMTTTTIWHVPAGPTVPEGVVCPAETGKSANCGSCALCWSPSMRDRGIAFIAHGNPGNKGCAEAPAIQRRDGVRRALAAGETPRKIARDLGISERAVISFRARDRG